jgi:hypothetical protein
MKLSVPDLVGGLLVLALGLFVFLYAQEHYRIGTARSMGPGYFPAVLGLVTMSLGGLIVLAAFRRSEPLPEVAWRAALWVFAAILAFFLGMRWFGLVPAIFMTVVVSSLGDPDSRPLGTLLLAVAVSAFCWAVFSYGLGLPIPVFKVPF